MALENQSLRGSDATVGPVPPPSPYLLEVSGRPIPLPQTLPPPAEAAWLSMLKHTRAAEWAGLVAKLIGAGLFATLVYTYCNVLIEACIRGIH